MKDLRPCIVNGKKALFHTFFMIGGDSGGVMAEVFAIVEYEDGTVGRAYISELTFTDTKPPEIVVPVVHCKDCQYFRPDDPNGETCTNISGMTEPDEDDCCSRYRALFAKKETAEDACRNPRNPNMDPFCITGDPIHAIGSCYCRECKHYEKSTMKCFKPVDDKHVFYDYAAPIWKPDDFCSYGEPREA